MYTNTMKGYKFSKRISYEREDALSQSLKKIFMKRTIIKFLIVRSIGHFMKTVLFLLQEQRV